MTYQFLKRLTTPFSETEAFKFGLIDDSGKKLKSPNTPNEHAAWGYFDRLVFNLKKLISVVPFGKTKLASYAAALFMIREQNNRYINDHAYLAESFEGTMRQISNQQLPDLLNLREASSALARLEKFMKKLEDQKKIPKPVQVKPKPIIESIGVYAPIDRMMSRKQVKALMKHPAYRTYIHQPYQHNVIVRKGQRRPGDMHDFVVGNAATGIKHTMGVSITSHGKILSYTVSARKQHLDGTNSYHIVKHGNNDTPSLRKVNEDSAANAVGGGNVAGLGVGSSGEPGGANSRVVKMIRRRLAKLRLDVM